MQALDRPDALAGAISRAVGWLETRQLPNGAFPHYRWIGDDRDARVADPSVFPNTLIAYSLSFFRGSAPLQRRVLDFLEGEADRRGLWRHWSRDNPCWSYACPDLDDTCCASLALIAGGRTPPANRARILANRNRAGLFRTWIITLDRLLLQPLETYGFFTVPSSRPGDVDGVVNANVLFYLGDLPETRAAADYLVRTLRENRETVCDKWYDNPFVVWYFFSRALAGRSPEAAAMIEERILAAAPAEPLDLALSACSLLHRRREAAAPVVERLLATQLPSGAWPLAPVYKGGNTKWGSEELVTAFAVEALARWSETAAG